MTQPFVPASPRGMFAMLRPRTHRDDGVTAPTRAPYGSRHRRATPTRRGGTGGPTARQAERHEDPPRLRPILRFGLAIAVWSVLVAVTAIMALAGVMRDPAAAALLRIARQVGTLPNRPLAKVLVPALFPEMARLTAADARNKRGKMALRSGGSRLASR